jgi:hypothetical protein
VIDWWGLADREITEKGQSLGRIDPVVLLRRAPDFIVLYSPEAMLTPTAISGALYIVKNSIIPEFLKNYQRVDALFLGVTVACAVPTETAVIWVARVLYLCSSKTRRRSVYAG